MVLGYMLIYPIKSQGKIEPLLNLLEKRFGIYLHGTKEYLREVEKHYREKREFILAKNGEIASLTRDDYVKSFLISEAARLMILREIEPRPKKKKKK